MGLSLQDKRSHEFFSFLVIPRSPASFHPLTWRQVRAFIVAERSGPALVFAVRRSEGGRGGVLGSGFDDAVHGSIPEIVVTVMGRRRSPEGSSTAQEIKSGRNKVRVTLIYWLIFVIPQAESEKEAT